MSIATLSRKGQITLPARIRRKLGIQPHDRLVIDAEDDSIVIRKAADFLELQGFLGRALPRDEEMRRMKAGLSRRERGETE